ncbi:hypothetical protein XELAEV_18040615mg [Xenopus laevis]|uniref:Uncharacterized protein n=1 Tax=Xenopus laevis TaxID=8355 RepID=A0A974H9H2_XENLA|nr:hypothetical protein XELAEV_18040615mg [Xenopus laevis]
MFPAIVSLPRELSRCPTDPLSVSCPVFTHTARSPGALLTAVPQRRYYPAPCLQSDSQARRHKSHHARLRHQHYL